MSDEKLTLIKAVNERLMLESWLERENIDFKSAWHRHGLFVKSIQVDFQILQSTQANIDEEDDECIDCVTEFLFDHESVFRGIRTYKKGEY